MRLVTTKYKLICNILFAMFWVLATYNFVTQEATGDEVPAVEFGVRLLGQGTVALLGLWTLRSRADMLIILVFCVFTFVGTVWVNHQTIFTWVDGIRLYAGFLFILPIVRYLLSDKQMRDYFIARMDRNIYRFLWLQVPCIVWQFFRYANLDLVGGTLGYMMSGVISNLIYLCSFYLMLRRWDKTKNYVQNILSNWVLLFLLLPSFLNETKVSLVFMLMYFFFLIPMDRKFVKRLIWILPIIFVVMTGAVYLYISVVGGKSYIYDSASAAKYLVGDEAALHVVEGIMEHNELSDANDFPRGLKLLVTPAIMNRNPPAWIWGYGIGQYKVGDSANKVPFAKQYQWLLIGTMMQGHVFWLETGLVGVGLYIIYWFVVMQVFRRRARRNRQLQWFLGLNVALVTVYNTPFLVIPFCIIFFYILLVCIYWNSLPAYKPVRLLGSRPIRWSLRPADADKPRKEAV